MLVMLYLSFELCRVIEIIAPRKMVTITQSECKFAQPFKGFDGKPRAMRGITFSEMQIFDSFV